MSEQDLNACAELVQRSDPDRFAAVLAAKPAARDMLLPIYAFNVEVARAPWVTQETMIAEMRLQWWRDALEEIREGKPVRRHEVVSPLAEVLSVEDAAVLDRLIEARRWDIYKDPFEDLAHQTKYLQDTGGGLLLAAARSLGSCEENVALDAGYALALANWLVAIPVLEGQQRVPLVDGRPETVRMLAKDGLARLSSARGKRESVSKEAGQAFLSCWQVETVLSQAEAEPERVAQGALGMSEFGKRVGLLLRGVSGRW